MSSCGAGCNRIISVTDKLVCSNCNSVYHYGCVGISKINFTKLSAKAKSAWKCPACKVARNNDDTPIKESSFHSDPYDGETSGLGLSQELFESRIAEQESMIIKNMKVTVNEAISGLRAELENFKSSIETSVQFISDKYDDTVKALTELRTENAALRAENSKLQENIRDLNIRVSTIEQQSRENNIELQCVPEHSNENLLATVKQLSNVISCPILDSDVLSVTRVARMQAKSSRPRSIIVKMSSVRTRDALLASCYQYNKKNANEKLNTSHLGIAGEKLPIYVAEHLSPANRALQAQARAFKKEHNYKYLWVRNGRVLLRKDDQSTALWVKNSEMLQSLCARQSH